MPATSTPLSTNLTSFDLDVTIDLHAPSATVGDLSSYLPGGELLVQGIVVTIVHEPTGLQITPNVDWLFPTLNGASPDPKTFALPTVAGKVMTGKYVLTAVLRDNDNTEYPLSKEFVLEKPKQCDGGLADLNDADANINLVMGQRFHDIDDNTVYVYNGINASSWSFATTVQYPVASQQGTQVYPADTFMVEAFDGDYVVSASHVATFEYGDNVRVKVTYVARVEKYSSASLHLCWLYCGLREKREQVEALCGNGGTKYQTLKQQLVDISLLALEIESGRQCGYNVSEQVGLVKKLIGGSCACRCGAKGVDRGFGLDPAVTIKFKKLCPDGDLTLGVSQIAKTLVVEYTDTTYVFQADPTQTAAVQIVPSTNGCKKIFTLSIDLDHLPTSGTYAVPSFTTTGATDLTPLDIEYGPGVAFLVVLNALLAWMSAARAYLVSVAASLANLLPRVAALEQPLQWHTAPLNAAQFTGYLQYAKDLQGRVHFRSQLQVSGSPLSGPASVTVDPIPDGYRPPFNWYASQLALGIGRGVFVNVQTTGALVLVASVPGDVLPVGNIVFFNTVYSVTP